MATLQDTSLAAYRALHEGLAVASGADRATLGLQGPDAPDFLQRLLSSDLRDLEPGTGQWSAMLDGKGKWISDLLVYRRDDEAGARFLLDLPAALVETVDRTLDRMHFGEELGWEPVRADRLLLLGPRARGTLEAANAPAPAAADDAPAAMAGLAHAEWRGGHVIQRGDRGVPCWEVLAEASVVRDLTASALADGALEAGVEALETARIEAGIARYGADFGPEDSLPESSEWRRASIRKGCYAGQEVVAKIHTYGEAPWQLCQLSFSGTEAPLAGRALLDEEGTSVGTVNSWAWSPMRGKSLGLGRLRRTVAQDGCVLRIENEPEGVSALVSVPEKILG